MAPVMLGTHLPDQIALLDTETTGVDVETARIVTCFIGLMDVASGNVVQRWSWLLNPGIEIPKGASDVHGITTERAVAEGSDPKQGIFEIVQRLDILDRQGLVTVVMNAPYDYSVIDREMGRYWPEVRRYEPRLVFDPMVFDRAVDKYRKGTRKLVDLARVYGVPVETNAHDAEADCRMAGRVAIKLLGHSRLQTETLESTHRRLITTKANQSKDLAEFWVSKKMPGLRRDLLAAQDRGDSVRFAEIQHDIAELIKSIESVRTTGHYWPMIPRPEDRSGATA